MPTYRFYNSKTKTEFEDYMTISDMEKFTKKKHYDNEHSDSKYNIKKKTNMSLQGKLRKLG